MIKCTVLKAMEINLKEMALAAPRACGGDCGTMTSPAFGGRAVCKGCGKLFDPSTTWGIHRQDLCAACGLKEERRLLDEAITRADEALRRKEE